MSAIKLATPSSGSISLSPANTASNLTITVPAVTATMATLTTPSFVSTIGVGGATPAASGAGITFPATESLSSDANTLDDYEEGTFTPTIIGTTTAGTGTYTYQVGQYTKIGNTVCVRISMNWTAHTGTGNMRVSGLPFISSNVSNSGVAGSIIATNITSPASTVVVGAVNENSSQFTLYSQTIATGALNQLAIDAVGAVVVSVVYQI